MKVEITLKGRRMTTRNIERLCGMTKQEVVDLKRELVGEVTDHQARKLFAIKLATSVESTEEAGAKVEETISIDDTVSKSKTSSKGKKK